MEPTFYSTNMIFQQHNRWDCLGVQLYLESPSEEFVGCSVYLAHRSSKELSFGVVHLTYTMHNCKPIQNC